MSNATVRVLSDGQIGIDHDGHTWVRTTYGDWDGPGANDRRSEERVPREIVFLWKKAVAAALALNGADHEVGFAERGE